MTCAAFANSPSKCLSPTSTRKEFTNPRCGPQTRARIDLRFSPFFRPFSAPFEPLGPGRLFVKSLVNYPQLAGAFRHADRTQQFGRVAGGSGAALGLLPKMVPSLAPAPFPHLARPAPEPHERTPFRIVCIAEIVHSLERCGRGPSSERRSGRDVVVLASRASSFRLGPRASLPGTDRRILERACEDWQPTAVSWNSPKSA